ncbi:CaiB/BaiF CoA-transferase family protein [Mesorhizobium sp. J428]|uniref:CaiB/BaiF CoA transferase family protein n=1 Tax=Mesorhizobium sp. J428 TaxID=2898440 RepID=UPI002151836A|nr:CaiB/BaiF CoA-transferase family protein [Mesorhizobium sp. J428]MCR5860310.1 CoA transferase [Mesorhizobium sp. J428]
MNIDEKGPLHGLLVVALEQAVAAPFCSSRLADAGARVIKVERKGSGDFARGYDRAANGESAYFVWLNRGKESLELDIKDPDDRALLERILARADVFLQNLAPGSLEKLELDSASLRARFPQLVTCDITGYGDDGPMRNAKAYDLLVQCESGLASITGTPDGPGRVGISVCDIATGMTAHAGICEALIECQRTGRARGVSVAMFDTMADWMAVPLIFHDCAGRPTPRVGLSHPVICPYGAYTCRDGGQIVLSVQNEREWARFCNAVLKRPELVEDPRFDGNDNRNRNRDVLQPMIESAFAALDRAQMLALLSEADIASGAVNNVAALSSHPQLDRTLIQCPSGEVGLPAPPIRRSGENMPLGASPALGAHNAAIRREFAVPVAGEDQT